METAFTKITNLLEKSIGLTVTSIGASTFARALNNRKKALGIENDEGYLEKLTVSFMELRRLVEEVVVPETWFFRDQEPFFYLKEYIVKSDKDLSVDMFRILSLPCSTGEEPYSIAMTLLQAGLKPTSFYIDAVDVSGRSLAVARKGVYKQNSFRTKDIEFRNNFFYKTEEGYALNSMVREKVRFLQGNMLQSGFLDSLGRYDVVFCRNVLIYFNKEAQMQVINALYNLLTPEGLLFTGHSEASLFMGTRFAPVSHSRAFAFHKRAQMRKETRPSEQTIPQNYAGGTSDTPASPLFKRPVPVPGKPAQVEKPKREEDEFASARKLADAGNLEDAAGICEKYLRQSDPSAGWYYLLGVIRDSQGLPEEALKFFRKAVYLDPDNVESLIQLSLLAERAGNIDIAENYKRRARRLQGKG